MATVAKNIRTFALIDDNFKKIDTLQGAQPRDAALKAARKGYEKIDIKENGTNKIHRFVAVKEPVSITKKWTKRGSDLIGGPSPESEARVSSPVKVKKIGIHRCIVCKCGAINAVSSCNNGEFPLCSNKKYPHPIKYDHDCPGG